MTKLPPDASPKWLQWAREIRSLAQAGITYTKDQFDKERYSRLIELSAEIVAEHEAVTAESVLSLFNAQTGYSTPKVSVRAAVFQNKKILLVQEKTDGLWSMPGGWADVGEGPRSVLEREVWEEASIKVDSGKLVALLDVNRSGRPLELFHAYKLIFLCTAQDDGAPAPGFETKAAGYFSLGNLPPLSSNRTNLRDIELVKRHRSQPELPTHVDY